MPTVQGVGHAGRPMQREADVSLTLYLVRHGETVYNVERRLQGWCDSPLTPDGAAGVRATASDLAHHRFTAAYTSPSERAVLTAIQILAHHLTIPLVEDPDLREFGFGELEARPESDLLVRLDPYRMFVDIVGGSFAGFPGGERGPHFRSRVLRALGRIERAHPGGEVLVVSHCLTLLAYLTMVDPTLMFPPANAGVSVVEVAGDGSRRIVTASLTPEYREVPAAAAR